MFTNETSDGYVRLGDMGGAFFIICMEWRQLPSATFSLEIKNQDFWYYCNGYIYVDLGFRVYLCFIILFLWLMKVFVFYVSDSLLAHRWYRTVSGMAGCSDWSISIPL